MSVTNVIQLILLIAITLVIGYTALQRFDSPSEVFAYTTPIYGEQIRIPSLFVMWAIAMLLQQTMSNNHTLSCYRFLTTANDKDATKAAFVAGVLFVLPLYCGLCQRGSWQRKTSIYWRSILH